MLPARVPIGVALPPGGLKDRDIEEGSKKERWLEITCIRAPPLKGLVFRVGVCRVHDGCSWF